MHELGPRLAIDRRAVLQAAAAVTALAVGVRRIGATSTGIQAESSDSQRLVVVGFRGAVKIWPLDGLEPEQALGDGDKLRPYSLPLCIRCDPDTYASIGYTLNNKYRERRSRADPMVVVGDAQVDVMAAAALKSYLAGFARAKGGPTIVTSPALGGVVRADALSLSWNWPLDAKGDEKRAEVADVSVLTTGDSPRKLWSASLHPKLDPSISDSSLREALGRHAVGISDEPAELVVTISFDGGPATASQFKLLGAGASQDLTRRLSELGSQSTDAFRESPDAATTWLAEAAALQRFVSRAAVLREAQLWNELDASIESMLSTFPQSRDLLERRMALNDAVINSTRIRRAIHSLLDSASSK